jgi:hypothetical protein
MARIWVQVVNPVTLGNEFERSLYHLRITKLDDLEQSDSARRVSQYEKDLHLEGHIAVDES